MDLEIALEPLQCCCWVKVLGMKPVELLVDILLWKDENLELFALNEVWAFGDLFDKHTEQVAPFTQEIFTIATKALLFRQRWDVEAR